jgi:RpiB/LacA/LacB family sugar-phosphate isomerase
MKISIGADHKGVLHKKAIIDYLEKQNFVVFNEGPDSEESVDYPDYAKVVARKVASKEVDFGILVCYTGIGMSIAANKVKGVRASLVGIVEDAILTREHNNSNVLCLSAKNTTVEDTIKIVDAYLKTSFTAGRHSNRVEKICLIENEER